MSMCYDQYKAEVLARADYAEVYSCIKGQKRSGVDRMVGLCPFHDDHNPSFGFDTKSGAWECFAGCGKGDVFEFLKRRDGKGFKQVLNDLGDQYGVPRPGNDDGGAALIAYEYRDEDGTLLYQVVRKPGKKFRLRRPDGNGGWIWKMGDVRRVLYRLPDLVSRLEVPVYLVEGEKDADRLAKLGLLSTTSPGGAGKWRDEFCEILRGRDVVILPDNDSLGRTHAAQVASSLQDVAASIRVVELPSLPNKGDVSDWFNAGHSPQELQALATTAGPWISSTLRPHIQINQRQQSDVIPEAWDALLAQNDPPKLFVTSGGLARIVIDDCTPRIELVDEPTVYGLLIRAADWHCVAQDGDQDAKPPKEMAKDILAFPHPDLPRLDAVVSTPVFDAQGHLINKPGYHPDARLWFHRARDESTIPVPKDPTSTDVEKALGLLREHLLIDFPFTAESDEAHALAALLLPFVRRMIDGPTPIHLIEAPSPGSGKSLLADLVAIIATGRKSEATTLTRDENEARKKITAILSRGRPVVVIDNVHGGLESSQLASAVTADIWSDRILGKTQMVEFPNRAVWVVTGNNPKLTLEIARRSIRVRLEPAEERPWQRTGFKHDPIYPWVQQRRHALVRAVLVIVQDWIGAGQPPGTKTLGSFENWAEVVGGILCHAGVRGFLEDTSEFYEAADSEGAEWRAFMKVWWDTYRDQPVGIRDLLALADEHDLVGFAYAARSETAQRQRLGRQLTGLRDRKFGDHQVVVGKDTNKKTNTYRLVPVTGDMFSGKELS